MTDKDISPDKAAQIAAIKARLAKSKQGGDAPAAAGAGAADAPAPSDAGGGGAPAGDRASQIEAIKARLAQVKAGGDGGGAAAAASGGAAAAGAAAGDAGPEDVQARIAALKAKMEAGKASAGPAAAAAAPKAAAPRAPKDAPKAGKGKNIYPVEPINRTTFGDERLYGGNTLNNWFLISAVALLVTVIGMWVRDHARDWKAWQRLKKDTDVAQLQAEVEATGAGLDQAERDRLTAAIARAEESVAAKQTELDALYEEKARLEGVVYATSNLGVQLIKSKLDTAKYEFEGERILHGGDEEGLAASQEDFQALQQEFDDSQAEADAATIELDRVKADIALLEGELSAVQKESDEFFADLTLVESNLEKLAPTTEKSGFLRTHFEKLRNQPMLDMLARTEQINQIVLDKLHDNYNFMYVGRIDRCTTCHLGIDSASYVDHDPRNENGERVLNAHPRLDLYVADGSAHPMGEFGCTVCHQGRGQAVEFPRTFHIPAADAWEGGETAEQKQDRWVEEYGYDPERHYWDWPMVPQDKIYSSCFQCHQDEHRIPAAEEYNRGREVIEDNGCYGCHKIEGFEYLRKPGPDLTNLTSKVDEDWLQRWVTDPKGFRGSTRMPHFWNQSNKGADADELVEIGFGTTAAGDAPQREETPWIAGYRDIDWSNNSDRFVSDYGVRNDVEARALATYVYDQSRQANDFSPLPTPGAAGDAEAGRSLFEKRGCLGCHGVESEGWTESDHGPDLSAIGAKVNDDWLYNWLLDPKAYWPETAMPDLRLSEQEAWDITSWLMTLQAPTEADWLSRPSPAGDDAVLDGIAVEYKSGLTSVARAREQVGEMRASGGRQEVELYVGQKLFQHYGCAGCHSVPGHYEDAGIGTELTKEGLKEVSKFDYGFEYAHENPLHIDHTRHAWFRAKLRDPRVFDRMPVIATGDDHEHTIERYEMKVKRPDEKLKMPNFYLDDEDVELAVQFLMGLREDGIDDSMKRTLAGDEQVVERASRLMTEVNCVGCHRIGQEPSRVAFGDDLIEEGLDHGLWMANALEVDGEQVLAEGDWFSDLIWNPEEEDIYDTDEYFEEAGLEDSHLTLYGHGEGEIGQYIEDKALRPPVLNGQGAKVESDWLYEFLLEPYTVRNHVEVRMPTFGFTEAQSRDLAHWFALRDEQDWPFGSESEQLDQDLLATGAALFGKYNCNSCHPSGSVLPSNPDKLNWGPDLSMAAERLKGRWINSWLHDPQLVSPGTKMPNFIGEHAEGIPQAEYEGFVDDVEGEIDALRHYMKFMQEWAGEAVSKN